MTMRGLVSNGEAGAIWQGSAGRGLVWQASICPGGCGQGEAGEPGLGTAWRDQPSDGGIGLSLGAAGVAWPRGARHGDTRAGTAGPTRLGPACPGQPRRGCALQDKVGQGAARQGRRTTSWI